MIFEIPIKEYRNRIYRGKTYYTRVARIPKNLPLGKGTFEVKIQYGQTYLVFDFTTVKKPKEPKKKSSKKQRKMTRQQVNALMRLLTSIKT